VQRGDDRADREREPEADADVDGDGQQRRQRRVDSAQLQVAADHRADQLAIDNGELGKAGFGQCLLDPGRRLFEAVALDGAFGLRQPDQDAALGRLAVLLHHLFARQRVNGIADLLLGDRLLELHDDQRAAREVDAERHALRRDHAQTAQDDRQREA
jgi:hypothetical protein